MNHFNSRIWSIFLRLFDIFSWKLRNFAVNTKIMIVIFMSFKNYVKQTNNQRIVICSSNVLIVFNLTLIPENTSAYLHWRTLHIPVRIFFNLFIWFNFFFIDNIACLIKNNETGIFLNKFRTEIMRYFSYSLYYQQCYIAIEVTKSQRALVGNAWMLNRRVKLRGVWGKSWGKVYFWI